MSIQRSFLLCFAELPEGPVAFDAGRVGEFGVAGDVPGEDELDVVALLGHRPVGPGVARRTAIVQDDTERCVLVLGRELRLLSVELSSFHRLPPLLAGVRTSTGITGLVRRGDVLALFVDVDRLIDIAKRRV